MVKIVDNWRGMDYYYIFEKRYIYIIGLLLFCVMAVIIEIAFEIKKHSTSKKMMVINISYLTGLLAIYFFFVALPIIKDKSFINSNEFAQKNGIVYEEIHGGYRNVLRTIGIEVDGKKLRFRIAYADDGIHAGDKVKVTYIPNSTYAVVEKIE